MYNCTRARFSPFFSPIDSCIVVYPRLPTRVRTRKKRKKKKGGPLCAPCWLIRISIYVMNVYIASVRTAFSSWCSKHVLCRISSKWINKYKFKSHRLFSYLNYLRASSMSRCVCDEKWWKQCSYVLTPFDIKSSNKQ